MDNIQEGEKESREHPWIVIVKWCVFFLLSVFFTMKSRNMKWDIGDDMDQGYGLGRRIERGKV